LADYYRPKARQLQRRLSQFRRVEVVLAIAGVLLGALAASVAKVGLGAWIAVVTTISASVAAHVGATRYEYQLIEYLRTADELSRLRRDAAAIAVPAELDQLVVQCERIISIQNEGWMAKLSSTPEEESTT
jgi:SMODS and SLOG-associating 2TM effector domain 1